MSDDQMFTRAVPPDLLRAYTQEDMVASGIRMALSLAGPFGVVASEFLTEFVPNQRVDRLRQYVEELDERLSSEIEQFKAKLRESAAYAALAEQTFLAAVSTPDAQRRRDFAQMLNTGLTKSEVELADYETLLRLRQQLTEPHMLMLIEKALFAHAAMGDRAHAEFREKHEAVFGVQPPSMNDSEEVVRRWELYRHRAYELITLGLLRDIEGDAKSSVLPNVNVTHLGRMLLESVGR